MADAADDGDPGIEHGARDDLLVERPQILDRTAAAADDQHVDLGARVRRRNRGGDLDGRAATLNGSRIKDHRQRRHSSSECRQHIGERGGTTRGDDADCARKPGQGALACRREPACGFESGLEPSELFVERAETGHSRRLDIELKFAARFVDRRCRAHLDAQTILEGKAKELRLLSEQDTAYLGLLVLEQEVNVAGWCPRKV